LNGKVGYEGYGVEMGKNVELGAEEDGYYPLY